MPEAPLEFDHIHLVSQEPEVAAQWYVNILGGKILGQHELRNAPQINVSLGGMTLLIRGKRTGEDPQVPSPMRDYEDYSSHNVWGTDHFGFKYRGDLRAYCEELKSRGATFSVEPWEFMPGALICYISAPDGVSIEIVQAR